MPKEKPETENPDEIAVGLKKVYQEILDEEVPDRFQQLLQQLKERGTGNNAGSSE